MDFSKLAKVADSVSRGGKQNVPAKGRKVNENIPHPLDALEDRERITDNSSKVIIIDDVFIKNLSNTSRENRRKILSRLTDSQRRRVLSSLKRIKDNSSSPLLGFILLDDLLANVAFDFSDTSVSNLDTFLETQSYIEITEHLRNLIDQVKAGDVDLDKDGIEELVKGLEGRKSNLVESLGGEDAVEGFEIPEEEELTEEDFTELNDAVASHLELFRTNRDIKEIVDASEEVISSLQKRNRSYLQSSTKYWELFNKAFKEQFKGGDVFETLNSDEIVDSINVALDIIQDESSKLDEVFESDAITDQGEVVKDIEDESILKLLSEALESYVEGDSEKLEALANKSISSEVSEDVAEASDPEDSESDEANESLEDIEPEEEEDVELDEEGEPTADSATHLARRILQGKRANKLIDAFSGKVPVLRRVNFKVTDCKLPELVSESQVNVIDMPITCEEYQKLCPRCMTPVMQDVIEGYRSTGYGVECPPVSNYNLMENGTLEVNNGQLYIPTVASDIFEERLNNAENNTAIQEIISSMAVPVDKAMEAAAKCDNLPFIDPRFYKKSIGATAWSFDNENKPACLVECPEGNSIERCSESSANYHLFGVPYFVS